MATQAHVPQGRESIIKALVEGLTVRGACEVPVAVASFFEGRILSQNVMQTVCALCDSRSRDGRVEHGPYCPVTLARRLRDGEVE